LQGFRELIPVQLIAIYDEDELASLICGKSDINMEDLKANTIYGGSPHSQQIDWFWKIAGEFSDQDKVNLLKFVFGFEKAPLDGFRSIHPPFKITIKPKEDSLPTANTCFNTIKLPAAKSYQQLKDKLMLAITSNTGFDFS